MLTKTQVFTVLLGGLAVAGCQQDTTITTPQFDKPVSLSVNGSARVGQDVLLQVSKIEDSRCPANALCIRYGNANVAFSLNNSAARQTGTLCLGECAGKGMQVSDSTSVQLGSDRYRVILTDVQPYPGTTSSDTKPTAIMRVMKQ